jgi:hypothetical protein
VKAGLRAGDLILKINGKGIEGMDGLMDVMAAMKAGDRVSVIVSREGERKKFAFKTGGYEDVFEDEGILDEVDFEEIVEEEHEHGDHDVTIHGGVPKSGMIRIGDEVIELKGLDGEQKIITRGTPKSGRFFGIKLDDEDKDSGEDKDIRIVRTDDGKEIMLVTPKTGGQRLRLRKQGEDENARVFKIEKGDGKVIAVSPEGKAHGRTQTIFETDDGKIIVLSPDGTAHGDVFLQKHGEEVVWEDEGDEDVQVIETDDGKRIVIKKNVKVSGGKGHDEKHGFSFDVDETVKGLHRHEEDVQTKTFTFPGGKGVIQVKVIGGGDGEKKCNIEVHVEKAKGGACCDSCTTTACQGACECECKGTCQGDCKGTCQGECKGTCQGECKGTCDTCIGGIAGFTDTITVLGHGPKDFSFKADPKKKAKKKAKAKSRKNMMTKKNRKKNTAKKAQANLPEFNRQLNVLRGSAHPPAPPCHCCPECRKNHKCCGHDVQFGGRVIQQFGHDGAHGEIYILRKGDGGRVFVPARGSNRNRFVAPRGRTATTQIKRLEGLLRRLRENSHHDELP